MKQDSSKQGAGWDCKGHGATSPFMNRVGEFAGHVLHGKGASDRLKKKPDVVICQVE